MTAPATARRAIVAPAGRAGDRQQCGRPLHPRGPVEIVEVLGLPVVTRLGADAQYLRCPSAASAAGRRSGSTETRRGAGCSSRRSIAGSRTTACRRRSPAPRPLPASPAVASKAERRATAVEAQALAPHEERDQHEQQQPLRAWAPSGARASRARPPARSAAAPPSRGGRRRSAAGRTPAPRRRPAAASPRRASAPASRGGRTRRRARGSFPSPVRPSPISPAATAIFRYQTRCQRRPGDRERRQHHRTLTRTTIVRDRYRGSGATRRRSGGSAAGQADRERRQPDQAQARWRDQQLRPALDPVQRQGREAGQPDPRPCLDIAPGRSARARALRPAAPAIGAEAELTTPPWRSGARARSRPRVRIRGSRRPRASHASDRGRRAGGPARARRRARPAPRCQIPSTSARRRAGPTGVGVT